MDRRWRWLAGGLLITIGVVSLAGVIFHINFASLCLPIGLITIGLFFILRPGLQSRNAKNHVYLAGNVRRSGQWQVASEEVWIIICDVDLDFSTARIPAGETIIQIFGLIGDIKILLPGDVGISVNSEGIFSEVKFFGDKNESVMTGINQATPNYAASERRIRLETGFIFSDIKIQQVESESIS
jgi:lia operon protein LiaF